MTEEQKARYDKLLLRAESLMLANDWNDLPSAQATERCDYVRTLLDVARELRLGTTSRVTQESKPSRGKKAKADIFVGL